MAVKNFQFLSILFAAGCLIPAGAHLFALPGKIKLEAEAWSDRAADQSRLGAVRHVLLAAIASAGVLAFLSRRQPLAMWLALDGRIPDRGHAGDLLPLRVPG